MGANAADMAFAPVTGGAAGAAGTGALARDQGQLEYLAQTK
jgi:hypothetical protein